MALFDIESEEDCCLVAEYEDRESLSRSRQSLGISVAYVPTWTQRDGFREFFQNWKDAILETSKLERRMFKLIIKDVDGEYTAEARHPDLGNLLGYIRYLEDKGTLELTNFGAQLSRKCLDLGVTSKRDKENLAGTHGEGFKVAALVMARHGYQVRFEASSYYWSFRFGGSDNKHLYCYLSPISEKKLQKQMKTNMAEQERGSARPLKANNWEDVTVRIGRLYGPQWGEKIHKQQFLSWVKVAIDLDRPSKSFETAHGTLIQDENFGNMIYLKGLLLESQSLAKSFKFGYDLVEGAVNRDRQRLSNPGEEARILANIWEVPIREDVEDAIDNYVEMLLDRAQWGDVSRAESEISASTAKRIWQHLLERDSGKDYFYHDQDTADQDAELIRKSLKKTPIQLPRCVWIPLRRFKLARTAQEQCYHLLYDAPIAVEVNTPYSVGVKRALVAALCLDTNTQGLDLVFKSGSNVELNLLLEGSQLQVNDEWLDFRASHKNAPCGLSRMASAEDVVIHKFSCDHVINELYDLVLVELNKGRAAEHGVLKEKDNSLRLRVSESLRHMPRMIEIAHGHNAGEVLVSWTDPESRLVAKMHRLDLKCRVTLHRERTCFSKRFDLVGPKDPSDDEKDSSSGGISNVNSDCGCPEKVVLQKNSNVIFDNLESEDYFPMVARTNSQAFYGFPPTALHLSHTDVAKTSTGSSGSTSTTTSPLNSTTGYGRLDQPDLETTSDDTSIDFDSARHSNRSSMAGTAVLAFTGNEHISPSSKVQSHHASNLEIEAQQEILHTTEEPRNSRSKVEAQHQDIIWFTEVLCIKDKLIQDAKVTIEALEIRDQDSNGSIENFRIKIQQLRDENLQLLADRNQAEEDVTAALGLAHNAAARSKHSATGVRRGRMHDPDHLERLAKYARLYKSP